MGLANRFGTVLDQGIGSRNFNFDVFAGLQRTNTHELSIREVYP